MKCWFVFEREYLNQKEMFLYSFFSILWNHIESIQRTQYMIPALSGSSIIGSRAMMPTSPAGFRKIGFILNISGE
jgi:hypothetical protein